MLPWFCDSLLDFLVGVQVLKKEKQEPCPEKRCGQESQTPQGTGDSACCSSGHGADHFVAHGFFFEPCLNMFEP